MVGAAIPNFISIIFKKHPLRNASIVNYHLLNVIIPCSLLGSILGGIIQTLIPKIAEILLLVLTFGYFGIIFFKKFRNIKITKSAVEASLLESEVKVAEEEIINPVKK